MNKKWALVVQGGGMRAIYAAGALEVLMEQNLYSDTVYGTSAGALLAANYTSHDLTRNKRVMLEAMSNKDFARPSFFLSKGSIFDFHWLFEEAPLIIPFDLPTFITSPTNLYACATNLNNGEPIYFEKHDQEIFHGLAASCSLPNLCRKPVFVHGIPCLDGGVVEPVPFHKALEDGYSKMVIITTREKGFAYDEKRSPISPFRVNFVKHHFEDYPQFIEAYSHIRENFYKSEDEVASLDKSGGAFVIYPSIKPEISHIERNQEKLEALYQEGYQDMTSQLEALKAYLRK